jgi:hypothetical protein
MVILNGLGEAISETHLRMGRPESYPRSYSTRSLALVVASLQETPARIRGSEELVDTLVKIPKSSTGVTTF